MLIIGVDYHPSFQHIAFVDTDTGESGERRLMHSTGEARSILPGAAEGEPQSASRHGSDRAHASVRGSPGGAWLRAVDRGSQPNPSAAGPEAEDRSPFPSFVFHPG
jgi:hypothetical protein